MYPNDSHVQAPISRRVLVVLVAAVTVRPIVDLFGRFEGEALNPGGVIGVLFAIGILVLVLVSRGSWGLRGQGLLVLLAFIFMLSLTHVTFSDDPRAASVNFARLVVGYSSALLVPSVARIGLNHTAPAAVRAVAAIATVSLVPAAIAWLQFGGVLPYSYFDWHDGAWVGRPSGGYHQPNSLGRLLAFVALYVGVLAAARKLSTKWVLGLWLGIIVTTFVSTHRTSIAATAIIITASLAIAYANYDRVQSLIRAVARFALVGVAVSGVAVLAAPHPTVDFVGQSLQRTARVVLQGVWSSSNESGVNLRGRERIWLDSIEHLAQREPASLLFGAGSAPFEAHNELLNAFMLYGTLGVAALAMVHGVTLMIAWSTTSRTGRKFLLVPLLYYLMFSTTLQPLDYPYFMWLYFAAQTLVVSMFRRHAKPTHRPTHDTLRSAQRT